MLIRREILEAIAAGKVRCAYRRWKRPTVKTGGTLKTSVGLLGIERVAPVTIHSISERNARLAGYATRSELIDELAARSEGLVYRIDLRLEGPDPRIALGNETELTGMEIDTLRAKLSRMDSSSPFGAWTERVLESIRGMPKARAADLALRLGLPKEWLKRAVRRLKNLGLTVSHRNGYELSPRGRRLSERLRGP